MANIRKSDPLPSTSGRAAPIRTTLMESDRVTVPANIRDSVDWLDKKFPTLDVLYELNEPGRACVLRSTEEVMSALNAAAGESTTDADDLSLIYSRGKFVKDRLDLSAAVLAHLGFGPDAGKEEVFVLVRSGVIEIWSAAFWRLQVTEATRRQRNVKEALRESGSTAADFPPDKD